MIKEQSIEAIIAENRKLKSENTRLKKRLGLPIEKVKKPPTIKKSLRNMKLQKLTLSNRTVSALNKQKVFTVGDLIAKDHIDLLCFKNIGMKTISEIEKALEKVNLQLEV